MSVKRVSMDTSKISLARVLALLVFLLGIQSAWADVWDGVTKTPAKTEKINGKDYFLIESAANLAWFSDTVNRSTAANVKLNAKVVANFIDMNHKPFVPIAAGKGDKYYGGIFDGNHDLSWPTMYEHRIANGEKFIVPENLFTRIELNEEKGE